MTWPDLSTSIRRGFTLRNRRALPFCLLRVPRTEQREGGHTVANKKVKVTFTEQQMMLLDKLKQEGTFGKTYEEIIPAVFREYVNQTFGVGGLK